jgi:hypothetical protein
MEEERKIKREQDREYEVALLKSDEDSDLEKALKLSEEEHVNKIITRSVEDHNLKPPALTYDHTKYKGSDIYNLKFRFSTGSYINYTVHRKEPIISLIRQLNYHLKTNNCIRLLIPVGKEIMYTENSLIADTEIKHRMIIIVEVL